jgi:prolipoprotein diacylglyceryl transferase
MILTDVLEAYIRWAPDPTIFDLGGWGPRWYGLFFAGSFLVSIYIMTWVFKVEGKTQQDLDRLSVLIIACTVIGARLGHCIFYDPEYYLFRHPEKIIAIWEGGLASHGATFAIIFGVWWYSSARPDQPFLWVADRLVIPIAFCAIAVRLGNFMNSEICGLPTALPWGVTFAADHLGPGADCYCDGTTVVARHPTQLYEAISYLGLFIWLLVRYNKYRSSLPLGSNTGILLTVLFTARFLIEFVKVDQEAYTGVLPINTGQLLSLPLIALGLYIWLRARKTAQA